MTARVQGTFVLEGMLEGPLPHDNDTRQRFAEAVAAVGAQLPLHLELDGASFNILARGRAMDVPRDQPTSDYVAGLLNQMLGSLPRNQRGEFFSTFRSVEYRPGMEIQTIYFVGPEGGVSSCDRVVDAHTTAPATSRRSLLLKGLLLAGLTLLAGTALLVDYRGLLGGMALADPSNLQIESGAFQDLLVVTPQAVRGRVLELQIARGDSYPQTPADYQRLLEQRRDDLPARLAVEAVARGYLRLELFDRHGRFIGEGTARLTPLRDAPATVVEVNLTRSQRLHKIRLLP